MVRFQFFPRSIGVAKPIEDVLNAFKNIESEIDSKTSNKKSDDVLAAVGPYLTKLKYNVEKDKSSKGKIDVPVLFGNNNTIDKSFYADAISCDGKIVIEVEAGRATENNQFLKDIFEASMMFEVEYLILAVRNIYRGHDDFERIYTFLETMYISKRIKLPLKGILLIGYWFTPMQTKIVQQKYDIFIKRHQSIPKVAQVVIEWKDDNVQHNYLISLDDCWVDDLPYPYRKTEIGNLTEEEIFFHAGNIQGLYDLIKSDNNISLDYFIALVKGGQYTASFLVFEDNFSSLGLLTNYIWFKVIYYVFLSLAYILYSITLITLI